MKLVKNIVTATILGAVTYFALAPLALGERGYNAVGGEMFAAVMVGLGYLYYKEEVAR